MGEIESSINLNLASLDAADRQELTDTEPSAVRREEKIAKLKTSNDVACSPLAYKMLNVDYDNNGHMYDTRLSGPALGMT